MIFEELEKKIAQFLESKQADSLALGNSQENRSSSPQAIYLDNYNTTTTITTTTNY